MVCLLVTGASPFNLEPQLSNPSSEFNKRLILAKLRGDVCFQNIRFVELYADDEGREVPVVRRRRFVFGAEYVADLDTYAKVLHDTLHAVQSRITCGKFRSMLLLLTRLGITEKRAFDRFVPGANHLRHTRAIMEHRAKPFDEQFVEDDTIPFPPSK